MSHAYEQAIREELSNWPGVEVTFGMRSKHREAVLHYRGTTRFVVYPDSPSDGKRGHLNCMRDLRKELRTLGAENNGWKSQQLPKAPKRRRAAKRPERNPLANTPLAPVKANPFEALAALRLPEEVPVNLQGPAKATPTRSAKTLRGLVRRMVARCRKAFARKERA